MKKILTIGDLHGKSIWKKFADIDLLIKSNGNFDPDYDYYIFIGDYTDAFDKSNADIYDNLIDVINFKKLYPDNVILLLGNHDIQYYLSNPLFNKTNTKYGCSGYRVEAHFDLYELFNKNEKLFQIAFQYKNYLWTHAGVHKGWYMDFDKNIQKLIEHYEIKVDDTLSDKLNISFKYKLDCLFDVGIRRGGDKKVGGPLWVDKELSYKKPLDGYHQIVGHSNVNKIKTFKKDENTSITYVDVLQNIDEFYNLIIN